MDGFLLVSETLDKLDKKTKRKLKKAAAFLAAATTAYLFTKSKTDK